MLGFFGGGWEGARGLFRRFEVSPFISSISILNGATHTNCKHGGYNPPGSPGGRAGGAQRRLAGVLSGLSP